MPRIGASYRIRASYGPYKHQWSRDQRPKTIIWLHPNCWDDQSVLLSSKQLSRAQTHTYNHVCVDIARASIRGGFLNGGRDPNRPH
jgi:hypothetical protein